MDIDDVPEAIVRLDADRHIAEANRALAALVDRPVDELVGASGDVLDPRARDGKPIWAGDWHPSARLRGVTRVPEQVVDLLRADGSRVRTHASGAYQRGTDGQVEGLVLVLREAGRRERLAVSGIEIISTVSHELRSPLTSVKGYTSLLLNRWDRLTDEQKQMMLEQVQHDADRVTRLITELLDISRLETGRLVLRRQLVDLPELAATVMEKVRFGHDDLTCEVTFADGFPRVFADPDKIEQVLTNLVENAAKYGSPQDMRVVGEVGSHDVTVSVTDRGPGIPAADLGRIFQKFVRRHDGRPTGSGLGLWISRGLIEAHGGELSAMSTEGAGSTFRFTLPLDAQAEVGA